MGAIMADDKIKVQLRVEIKTRIKGEFWLVHYDDGDKILVDGNLVVGDYIQDGVIAITHHTYDGEEGEGLK